MWSVNKYVIVFVGISLFYFLYLLIDCEHYFYEILQFPKAFAFRRLYHQCTVYRERKSRSMVAVIHQTLCNVILADTCFLMYLAAFQNHFVTYISVCSAIYDAVSIIQTSCQIVCIQNSDLGSLCQSFCSHHANIAVGDSEDTRAAERCC